jgi:two-component system, OmpR family, response regulator RegX3
VTLAAGGQGRQPTILVVDDDPRMQLLVQAVLRREGFGVLTASDGDVVLGLVKRHQPDALVLDLKMPTVSGLEALRAVRSAGEDVPIVVLTGLADEDWVLDAFEAGADDYVIKPFPPRILLARLRAVLRRREMSNSEDGEPGGDEAGEVALDPRTHDARVHGKAVRLTPTEYQLLRTLMRGAGRVFTTAELLARVWGPTYVGQDDIIRANIYRLRHKLEPEPGRPRYILGRRGVGYFFAGQAAPAANGAMS